MEDRSNLIDLTKDTSSLIKQETPESAADDRKPTNSISSTVHALAISDNYRYACMFLLIIQKKCYAFTPVV